MRYKQLDFQKRCQIYGLWRAGHNQTEIAKEQEVGQSKIAYLLMSAQKLLMKKAG